jgi:hypothetical protein
MVRLTQFSQSLNLNHHPSEIHMKAIKSLAIVASLFAAGSALAASSVVNMDTVNQSQGGNRNTQELEVGTAASSLFTGGTARATVSNIRQSQTGNNNSQSMILGKAGASLFTGHTSSVVVRNVGQVQSGTGNTQRMKVGVAE